MVMCCIDPGGASARSGGGGDAGASSSLRDDAIAPPGSTRTGRVFEAPEHRLPSLGDRSPASRRNAILGACPGNGHGLHRPRRRECQERRRRRCWSIVKPSRRRNRASWVDPNGPRFRGPGTSSAVACDAPSIAAQRHPSPRPRKRGAARDHYSDRLLVHRHSRMIHLIGLQAFGNIRIFLAFVNVPNESVH